MRYNKEHNITPHAIEKEKRGTMGGTAYSIEDEESSRNLVADEPVLRSMSAEQLKRSIINSKHLMEEAAKELDFIAAAKYRDEMNALKELLFKKSER